MKIYDAVQYGAAADGRTDCTEAINSAIELCSREGGGRVELRGGVFLSGRIRLLSNVCLYVAETARLVFKDDPAAYPPELSYMEGTACINYSAFLYAADAENISIEGSGVIDGQGVSPVWIKMQENSKPDKQLLCEMSENDVPAEQRVFGAGHNLRPNMIQMIRCRNITIRNINLINSPMWMTHLVLCSNVLLDGVLTINHAANGDGFDPEGCDNVTVRSCIFRTRDDGIAIKAFRNREGRKIKCPCRNILVENCLFDTDPYARNGIALGSELTAGIENVTVRNCEIRGRLRGIYIKSNTMRGGFVRNVRFENLKITGTKTTVVQITMNYGKDRGSYLPDFGDITLENITADGGERACRIEGDQPGSAHDITLKNCRFDNMQQDGLCVSRVENFIAGNVSVNGKKAEITV